MTRFESARLFDCQVSPQAADAAEQAIASLNTNLDAVAVAPDQNQVAVTLTILAGGEGRHGPANQRTIALDVAGENRAQFQYLGAAGHRLASPSIGASPFAAGKGVLGDRE